MAASSLWDKGMEPKGIEAEADARQDAESERTAGEHKYGDVKFADPENGKYPIDTEEHIRAA